MILDIGCGVHPKGDVNVDFVAGGDFGTKSTKANVYASVYHLPFRDKSFEVVTFVGLLHHLKTVHCAACDSPHGDQHGWHEMLRVCKDVVLGYEPNLNVVFPRDPTEKHHLYSRKRVLWPILRPHPGFTVTLDRLFLWRQKRTDWRIIAIRKRPV